jgi:ACS family hexuronate transporter-like MFS transporter
VHQSRFTMMWVGALIIPGLLLGVYADSAVPVVIGVSAALFGTQIKSSALFSLPADMFPARDVATVWGLCGAAGSIVAAVFQWLSGWMIDEFGYQPVFLTIACMHLVSVTAVLLVVRRIEMVRTLHPGAA